MAGNGDESREQAASRKRVYHTIDGLRGVAAAIVVLWHGGLALQRSYVASSYLAVDLFFLMSGFVIAFVYEPRLAAGMRLRDFVTARFVRLYPLYALGTLLSLALVVASLAAGRPSPWDWRSLTGAVVAASLLIPTYPPVGLQDVFPLNGPAWSLFYELLVNVVYVAVFPRLTTRRLVMAVVIALGALCLSVWWHGAVSGGAIVGRSDVVTGGIVRSFFSFPLGVLLYRLHDSGRLPGFGTVSAWAILACAILLLAIDPGSLRPWYDLVTVAVAFPILLIIARSTEPKWGTMIFVVLGLASYPVYVTQAALLHLLPHIPLSPALADGLFLVCLLGLGWALSRWFDPPARRWLNRMVQRSRSR